MTGISEKGFLMFTTLQDQLELSLNKALYQYMGSLSDIPLSISFSERPDLCHFQYNGCFVISKKKKINPNKVAQDLVLILNSLGEDYFIASHHTPGFINIVICDFFVQKVLNYLLTRKKITEYWNPQDKSSVIFDYGGPNIAKEMHIGHIRSATIGSFLSNLYKLCGRNVIRDIHLGDWGLPVAYVINEIIEKKYTESHIENMSLKSLHEIYSYAVDRSKIDCDYSQRGRSCLCKLQKGQNNYIEKIFRSIREKSIKEIRHIFSTLAIYFDTWDGESDSKDYIDEVFFLLKEGNFIQSDQGALIIPRDLFDKSSSNNKPPVILMSQYGAYLYITTDIITLYKRAKLLQVSQIIYIADKRQEEHFRNLFLVCRECLDIDIRTDFLGFGTVQSSDGKPLKSRENNSFSLKDCIMNVKSFYCTVVQNEQKYAIFHAQKFINNLLILVIKMYDLRHVPSKNYTFHEDLYKKKNDGGLSLLFSFYRVQDLFKREVVEDEEPNYSRQDVLDILALEKFSWCIKKSYIELDPSYIVNHAIKINTIINKILSQKNIKKMRKKVLKVCYMQQRIFLNLIGVSINEE